MTRHLTNEYTPRDFTGKVYVKLGSKYLDGCNFQSFKIEQTITEITDYALGEVTPITSPGRIEGQKWTAVVFENTTRIYNMIIDYKKTLSMPYMDFYIYKRDPQTESQIGEFVISYINCQVIGTVPLPGLDNENKHSSFTVSGIYQDQTMQGGYKETDMF